MPTGMCDCPYSAVSFSTDQSEPVHIHVKRDRRVFRFWLAPITVAKNRGFPDSDFRSIADFEALTSRTGRR